MDCLIKYIKSVNVLVTEPKLLQVGLNVIQVILWKTVASVVRLIMRLYVMVFYPVIINISTIYAMVCSKKVESDLPELEVPAGKLGYK